MLSYVRTANWTKSAQNAHVRRFRKKHPTPRKKSCGEEKKPIFFSAHYYKKSPARRKMLRIQNRVWRCAQPASRRLLLRKTVFGPKCCARATAQQQLINVLRGSRIIRRGEHCRVVLYPPPQNAPLAPLLNHIP